MFNNYKLEESNSKYIVYFNNRIYYLYRIFDKKMVISKYNISKKYYFYYKFIYNRFNSIFSIYNGNYYVLLEINNNSFPINYIFYDKVPLLWKNKWLDKIYYFNIKKNSLDSCYYTYVNYYLYLFELSLFYLNDYNDFIFNGYLLHEKFDVNELCNPLNIIIDVRERNLGEYLKYLFFCCNYNEIDYSFLYDLKYNDYNFDLVISRLLYPNYFINSILNDDSIDKIDSIINRLEEFERYLKMIFNILAKKYDIKKVDFFN